MTLLSALESSTTMQLDVIPTRLESSNTTEMNTAALLLRTCFGVALCETLMRTHLCLLFSSEGKAQVPVALMHSHSEQRVASCT